MAHCVKVARSSGLSRGQFGIVLLCTTLLLADAMLFVVFQVGEHLAWLAPLLVALLLPATGNPQRLCPNRVGCSGDSGSPGRAVTDVFLIWTHHRHDNRRPDR